ncbi:GLIPR1-like protein 1 [Saccostrea echinata]|uniref:GLIPR1-like protein 1 n=1 Tax=Saccostrea echinata TaxID=191078 RepID=UPI002A814891|nr:GLIPR1-like protein 1 [Saccostrea echinata]XP_061174554.1 GLIPR1-like protein 1 [Saccostrea echinata]
MLILTNHSETVVNITHMAKYPVLPLLLVVKVYATAWVEYVQEHNDIRSNAIPPAANMKRLMYSRELESIAQQHANRCSFLHNDNRSRESHTFSRVGENIFQGIKGSNISNAIQYWSQQGNFYNIQTNECQLFFFCEFYTQVTWADSEYVGCGKADCGTKTFVVCNYGPSSDLHDRPYIQAVSCSACPFGYVCEKNLCRRLRRLL